MMAQSNRPNNFQENSNSISDDADRNVENRDFTEISTLSGHREMVTALRFSCDGEQLASGGADSTIRVWNIEKSKMYKRLIGHKLGIMDLCWSKDNSLLVSASMDKTLRIWDVLSGKCLRVLKGHTSGVFRCNINPGSYLIVSGSTNGEIHVWDVKTGMLLKNLKNSSDTIRINSVCFNKDGSLILSGNTAGLWCIWEVASDNCLDTILIRAPISTIDLFSGGACVAVATYTGLVEFWHFPKSFSVEDIEIITRYSFENEYVTALMAGDDAWVITKSECNKGLDIWNLKDKRVIERLKCHNDQITCVISCHRETNITIAMAAHGKGNSISIWKQNVLDHLDTF